MNSKKNFVVGLVAALILLGSGGFIYYQDRLIKPERSNVLKPSDEAALTTLSRDNFSALVSLVGEMELSVMDFSEPMPLEPLPEGWWHRKFLTRAPMSLSFGSIEGEHGLRLATDSSASVLLRFVDVNLERYPLLVWRWLIEDPIETDENELTRAGDDHPARLFISFRNVANETRAMEVIWGNKLRAGEYKYIGGFPHYVANGGSENVDQWIDEEISLLDIYREIWPEDDAAPYIDEIGLFADSDETNDDSVAWFAYVQLSQKIDLPN
jgi:hypothetical protein